MYANIAPGKPAGALFAFTKKPGRLQTVPLIAPIKIGKKPGCLFLEKIMASGSEHKGQQKGRCYDCCNKALKKTSSGRLWKWCCYWGNWCQYVAWNCTLHYIAPLEGIKK
jgi:hypothetical protein